MTSKPAIAIVYASIHHGNTQKLATTLAAELEADLFPIEEARKISLASYQLVGLGSGIYFGRHHKSLRDLVDFWEAPPQRVFVFSTAGLPFLRWCQHSSLRRRLVRKGCQVLSEFCCRGWDTVGPLWLMGGINRKHPNSRDLDRAIAFAKRLLSRAGTL